MTLFPGSVHESAPTNTIILSPHPGADSACAAHSLVSRADVSLRAFQSGCSRSPLSCRVAGRRTHVCACVHAMQTCVHTSVLTLEHGQLQAGRQASRLRLPFRLPAHGLLATVFRVGSRGDGSYSRPCTGAGGSLLSTTSSSCERGERKWVGGESGLTAQSGWGCWTQLLPGAGRGSGEHSSRPAFPSGWELLGGGRSGLQGPLQPRRIRGPALLAPCSRKMPATRATAAGPAWGQISCPGLDLRDTT